MPAHIVKSIAEKSGRTESEIALQLEKVEGFVQAEYPNIEIGTDRYWALVTLITEKWFGVTEEEKANEAISAEVYAKFRKKAIRDKLSEFVKSITAEEEREHE